jgi:hypothetical protein
MYFFIIGKLTHGPRERFVKFKSQLNHALVLGLSVSLRQVMSFIEKQRVSERTQTLLQTKNRVNGNRGERREGAMWRRDGQPPNRGLTHGFDLRKLIVLTEGCGDSLLVTISSLHSPELPNAAAPPRLPGFSDSAARSRARRRRHSETSSPRDRKQKSHPAGCNDPDRCSSNSN